MELEQKSNILLVDDKQENLLALEAVLDGPSYNLLKARSGEEALKHLLENDFALVMLDVHMPGMDGFQTAELIRKRAKTRDIPIIFITAEYQQMEHIARGYDINAVDYILKPFDQEILRSKVAVLVDLQKKTEQVRQQAEKLEDINRKLLEEMAERKRVEEELTRTMAELTSSNTELEHFAYVASHDLQEPLRMVASYVQLLERRYRDKLDDDAQDFIGYAVDGVKRMQGMINSLLAYSRVGTHGKDFEPTDLNAVFDQALKNLKMVVEDTGAIINHDPLPTVMADSVQMVQLVQNLIANAIKFHGDEPPRIHVAAKQNQGEWTFSVKDNGIGLENQNSERIFLIFQRLHGKGEYQGSGIGLAICKKIVGRHGGHIWCESEPGKGSTFFFALPIDGG